MFEVEGMVVEYIMTLSELSLTSENVLFLTSHGSSSKFLLFQSKQMNHFDK